MSKKHYVIIGHGLDETTGATQAQIAGLKFITRNWPKKYQLIPQVPQINWEDGEDFESKLRRVINLIDNLAKKDNRVSLIGCSAGGSLMLNAFIQRKSLIYRVVNLDGFLRPGNAKGFRSFEVRSEKSKAFRESVLKFEKMESELTSEDRKKILTVRPLIDELVPPETVIIEGAINKQVPVVEHVLGIAVSLMLYDPVIMFLKGREL